MGELLRTDTLPPAGQVQENYPLYWLAGRRHLLAYHERLSVFHALCQEAPVEPDEKLSLIDSGSDRMG